MAQDYGYFGKGSAGYAHYTQAFNRAYGNGGGNGGNGGARGGCLGMVCLFLLAGGSLFRYFLR